MIDCSISTTQGFRLATRHDDETLLGLLAQSSKESEICRVEDQRAEECRLVGDAAGMTKAVHDSDVAVARLAILYEAIEKMEAETLSGILAKFALAIGSVSPSEIEDGRAAWRLMDDIAASAVRDLLALHQRQCPHAHNHVVTVIARAVRKGRQD